MWMWGLMVCTELVWDPEMMLYDPDVSPMNRLDLATADASGLVSLIVLLIIALLVCVVVLLLAFILYFELW